MIIGSFLNFGVILIKTLFFRQVHGKRSRRRRANGGSEVSSGNKVVVTTIEELDLDGGAGGPPAGGASSNSNLLMLDSMTNPLKACEVPPYGTGKEKSTMQCCFSHITRYYCTLKKMMYFLRF